MTVPQPRRGFCPFSPALQRRENQPVQLEDVMPQLVSPFACDAANFLFASAGTFCAMMAGTALRTGKAYKLLWLIPAALASTFLAAFFAPSVTDPNATALLRYQNWRHLLMVNAGGDLAIGAINYFFQRRVPSLVKRQH